MGNVVVVGAQWGDEGKGKIVDWLSDRADVVVRFQGGHNAGHTLVVGNDIQAEPAAVRRGAPGKLSVIGNGVVVDPWALLDEIDVMRGKGLTISPDNLLWPTMPAHLPLHRELERAREERRGDKIGTTGRGIGPAYEDKVGRRAIRVCDLADRLRSKTGSTSAAASQFCCADSTCRKSTRAELLALLLASRRKFCPMPLRPGGCSTRRARGRRMLFEGAQGACSTSTTAPIPSSPRPTRWRARPRPGRARPAHRLRAGHSRPIRPASARVRFRPS